MQNYTVRAPGARRRVVAWDTETCLIRPALLAPPLVCLTWQEQGKPAGICHRDEADSLLRDWLRDPSVILVGHNVAYDMAVVCEAFPHLRDAVFAAYDTDRVTDTLVRQHLLDIAGGCKGGRPDKGGKWITYEYSLERLAKRMAGMVLQKDAWRLSYGEFLDTPMRDWTERAKEVQAKAAIELDALDERIASLAKADAKPLLKTRTGLADMVASDPNRSSEYPLDDARATLAVYVAQEKHAEFLHDQYRQTRGDFALHLSSAWGLRTDAEGVERLRAATQSAADALQEELILAGLLKPGGVRNTKAAKARMVEACKESGLTLRRTDGHANPDTEDCVDANGNSLPAGDDACVEHICLDAESCTASGDPLLESYAELSTLRKVLTNDLKALAKGATYPIHTRYGRAETGRTTSSNPPIQNLCKREGIRESFIARPGMAFVGADYPALEAYTWAQCCFTWLGESGLAEALNGGLDPHLAMAANILRIKYDEAKVRLAAGEQEIADIRQLAKVANFGLPGGMGAKTFLASAKKQLPPAVVERLGLDLARAEKLKEEWAETWPEAKLYFDRIKRMGPKYPEKFSASVESLFTKRVRGGASYCAASNNGFQGLGADCAKEALWRLCRAQYVEPNSVLYNTRTVAFVHDEIIIEAPLAIVHECGNALADIMVAGANVYLPDVQIPREKVKPVAMIRWSKKAAPSFDVNGRLIPWDM